MDNWVNWLLVIGGIVCVIAEILMGALTGFDLALVGASLVAGGIAGFLLGSAAAGLIAASVLALLYLFLLRGWLKSRLLIKERATNADAVIGKTGVVTKRIASREAGLLKLGDEIWRAELSSAESSPREIGAEVTVESVDGVTLKVR